MKSGKKDEAQPLLAQKNELAAKKAELEKAANDKETELNKKMSLFGNLVHDTVPVSMDEKDNVIVKKWWPQGRSEEAEIAKKAKLIGADGKGVAGLMSHHEVLDKVGGYDGARGKFSPVDFALSSNDNITYATYSFEI